MKKLLLFISLTSAVPALGVYGRRYAYFHARPGYVPLVIGDPCWDSLAMGPDGRWYIDQCPYFIDYPTYYYSYVPGWWVGFGFGGPYYGYGYGRGYRGGRGGRNWSGGGRGWSGGRGGAARSGGGAHFSGARAGGGHGGHR